MPPLSATKRNDIAWSHYAFCESPNTLNISNEIHSLLGFCKILGLTTFYEERKTFSLKFFIVHPGQKLPEKHHCMGSMFAFYYPATISPFPPLFLLATTSAKISRIYQPTGKFFGTYGQSIDVPISSHPILTNR